ncbi:MAG: CBS domain-containing protein [Bacteroidales bacterium]|nr:CBS domain-containing protein [Bacteroidales bacterium]
MELSRNLRVDSVSRLGPTPPHQLDQNCPVADAIELMRHQQVGCILATQNGKVVGIFTERDLLTRVLAASRPLSTKLVHCMTPDPVTVSPKDSVRTAIKRMQNGAYRHLPVVDESSRPVGILSVKRIVMYLVEHFPGTVYNQPTDPQNNYPDQPEGA